MSEEKKDPRKHDRVGVGLLVKMAASNIDEFTENYATNISPGGIFLQCREPKPIGAVLMFEIRLKGGKVVIRGKGRVMWTRTRDTEGDKPLMPGMGVKFLALDKSSKAVLKRILHFKAQRGVTDGPQMEQIVAQRAEPVVVKPEVAEPKVVVSEVAEPEVAEPEVAEPEVAEPEVAEPEISQPVPAAEVQPEKFPVAIPPVDSADLAEAEPAPEDGFDIDLDLDEPEPEPEPEPAKAESPAVEDDSFDDDFEINIEDDAEDPPPADSESEADEADVLELDELATEADSSDEGFDIDIDDDLGEPAPAEETEASDPLADEFDIDIEADAEEAPAQEADDEDLEVDLALDNLMGSDDPPAPSTGDLDVDISLEDFLHPAPVEREEEPADKEPSPEAISPIIGIDLGTTNCCAAVCVDGKPKIILSRKGYSTIPSVVAYDEAGKQLTGHAAKAQLALNPVHSVYGSKRLVGRHFSSPAVQQLKERFLYEIIEGPQHEAAVRVRGLELSLQQVSGFILNEVRQRASKMLAQDVNRAVISVPAYYNENQRQAVREAGSLAGITVERIVNEPTAAALAYGFDRGLDKRVLVYDLGGGTFDVSVLDLCHNVYEVVATGGDTFLGGEDFDNQLLDHVLSQFMAQVGKTVGLDRVAMQRLREAVEAAKCALSESEETRVTLAHFASVDGQPVDLDIPLNRAGLEELVMPLVDRTMVVVEDALKRAGLKIEQVDEILLVGGQTRMPLIQRRIQEVLGKEVHKGVHPDEAVALGAALLGNSVGKIDSVVLIDVLAVSIGYGQVGGGFRRALLSGNALPSSVTIITRTYEDQQQEVDLTLFQGESERVLDNEYLGTVTISGITPMPKGRSQLKVTFSMDQEGLLQVTCCEANSGKENHTRMEMKYDESSLRDILRIPADETVSERVGVPVSLRQDGQEPDR